MHFWWNKFCLVFHRYDITPDRIHHTNIIFMKMSCLDWMAGGVCSSWLAAEQYEDQETSFRPSKFKLTDWTLLSPDFGFITAICTRNFSNFPSPLLSRSPTCSDLAGARALSSHRATASTANITLNYLLLLLPRIHYDYRLFGVSTLLACNTIQSSATRCTSGAKVVLLHRRRRTNNGPLKLLFTRNTKKKIGMKRKDVKVSHVRLNTHFASTHFW